MRDFVIRYWVEVVFGAATSILAFCYRKLSHKVKEQVYIKDGMLALLHDRLYQACEFYIKRGYCEIDDIKNLEYLYNSYHALGGNGTGTELYNRVKSLPLEERKQK